MLFVLFHLGAERYALEAQRVVEIVPLLALKKIPQAPRGVAGLFIYRGRPVPALDLCQLTLGRSAAEHFSTRIIIISYSPAAGVEQFVGLIVERATETLRREPKDFVESGVRVTNSAFLGPMLKDANGVVQLVNPERLLHQHASAQLFEATPEAGHATH
ncbi:MAG: chemotaxis protein CheW [Verrucomicrobiota bacterium]